MTILDCKETYILENSRVKLTPLSIEHADELMKINTPDLWKHAYVPGYPSEALASYINAALKKRQNLNSYPFIVYDKQSNQYCGSTRFYDIDLYHKTLKLGFTWYGKPFQGTGLNKNCKYLLLQFAFEQVRMERVEFYTDKNNVRSIAAMKSIGCVEEGILRSNFNMGEGKPRRTSVLLSIIKDDWEGGVKENLSKRIK